MVNQVFSDFNYASFWNDDSNALNNYVEKAPSDDLIVEIENELQYKLPASYIELMKTHNGGTPYNNCFPTTEPTSWADDHIAIIGIAAIGRTKKYALGGQLGSRFMIEEGDYPDIGICICDCPSAGHDIVMLDYTKCGPQGEPEVVHVDQEYDNKITFLAPDFETFIRGLVNESNYPIDEE